VNQSLSKFRTDQMIEVLDRIGRERFESVLDLGSDDGLNVRRMAKLVGARRAMGLDLHTTDCTVDGVSFRRGNLLEFIPDQHYALVISNQVFEHIYEPWLPRYFKVLRECCAPGGLILLSTPNRWRSRNLIRFVAGQRPFVMYVNPGVAPERHLGHHRECSYRGLRSILREAFPAPEFRVRILRTFPRVEKSRLRWIAQVLVYVVGWPLWRPLVLSASQDHYALIERERRVKSFYQSSTP
jgi:SAM-dependent methyltransferase